MAFECLALILFEGALAVVDHNLVVQTLADPLIPGRVERCRRDGLHTCISQVLRDNWDAELPEVNLLVVGGRDEPLPMLDECDAVD